MPEATETLSDQIISFRLKSETDGSSPLSKLLAERALKASGAEDEKTDEEEVTPEAEETLTAEGETADTETETFAPTCPPPKPGESEGDFMDRCQASMVDQGSSADDAASYCADMWTQDAKATVDGDTFAGTDHAAVKIDAKNPGRFRAVLAVEEERTADNRIISKDATAWRNTPLPLMLMTRTDVGHDGAVVAAVIENIQRKGNAIAATGRFDTGDSGVEAARLVANKVLNSVSIDAGDVEAELQVEAEDDAGMPTRVLQRMTALTILGATIVPFPAIGSAAIEWVDPGTTAADEATALDVFVETVLSNTPDVRIESEGFKADTSDCETCDEALVASGPVIYDPAVFADPGFDALTPIRVDANGRVSGHIAPFGECHIGFPGACVMAPRSKSAYSYFLTGELPTQDGKYQPVGTLTVGTMHAHDALTHRDTMRHYDDTGTAVAYVNVGEDEHGVWCSGVLKPGLSEEKATELCGASLSGDWRRIGGNLELVAVLGTNVPGFPIAHMENGAQTSLVAAGYGPEKRTKSVMAAQIDALKDAGEQRVSELQAQIAEVAETLAALQRSTAPLVRQHLATRFADEKPRPRIDLDVVCSDEVLGRLVNRAAELSAFADQ